MTTEWSTKLLTTKRTEEDAVGTRDGVEWLSDAYWWDFLDNFTFFPQRFW